jgi:AcrR family transcriptional regulator
VQVRRYAQVISADQAFQRARTAAQKQVRRDAILEAARNLGLRKGVRNVTVADMAGEVGLAQSNVLRYFGTREDIYLHLTAEAWREWTQSLQVRLDDRSLQPTALADALTQTLSDMPLFCDLLAHTHANFEHNASERAVRHFKVASDQAVLELTGVLATALPRLGEGGAYDLIVSATTLAARLWLRANPPAAIAALYKREPELPDANVEFTSTLRRLIGTFIEGLLTREPTS